MTEFLVAGDDFLYSEEPTVGQFNIFDIIEESWITEIFCDIWSCNGFLTEC